MSVSDLPRLVVILIFASIVVELFLYLYNVTPFCLKRTEGKNARLSLQAFL